ncbi:MAG: sulfatase [Verrucomicrobiales bacterium]|nr:sulfatase [Verrucomicrobiales bacterium]
MNRWFLIVIFGWLSVGQLVAEDRPNVLFISIDDLNDWIGCMGHPQVKTPHIDALAERGVNFTNAHCQAPICNPSRISMFLGKLPSNTGHYFLAPGFRDVAITRDSETLFQYFRSHGYFLSTMGKIFHGKADAPSFDHIERSRGWRRGAKKVRYTVPGTHPLWDWGVVDVPDEEQRDYQTAAWAAEQIPTLAKGEKPFFLAVGFHLPHVPIYASKKWFELYPIDDVVMPEAPEGDLDDVPETGVALSLNLTAPRDEWMRETGEDRHAVQAYLAANSFVDHCVGILMDSLQSSGAVDNTVVVLWSDHGFHLGEKKKWAKRSLWERSTRVPLIFAGAGISGRGVSVEPVGLIDVWPTLSELCDLPEKSDLDGTSLVPQLKEPGTPRKAPVITTFGKDNHSLRSRDFRYTRYMDGTEELYDHRKDPGEINNLAANPEYRAEIAKLKKWLPNVNAPAVPGSRGSDSPLYGEGKGLQNAMKRK